MLSEIPIYTALFIHLIAFKHIRTYNYLVNVKVKLFTSLFFDKKALIKKKIDFCPSYFTIFFFYQDIGSF